MVIVQTSKEQWFPSSVSLFFSLTFFLSRCLPHFLSNFPANGIERKNGEKKDWVMLQVTWNSWCHTHCGVLYTLRRGDGKVRRERLLYWKYQWRDELTQQGETCSTLWRNQRVTKGLERERERKGMNENGFEESERRLYSSSVRNDEKDDVEMMMPMFGWFDNDL